MLLTTKANFSPNTFFDNSSNEYAWNLFAKCIILKVNANIPKKNTQTKTYPKLPKRTKNWYISFPVAKPAPTIVPTRTETTSSTFFNRTFTFYFTPFLSINLIYMEDFKLKNNLQIRLHKCIWLALNYHLRQLTLNNNFDL